MRVRSAVLAMALGFVLSAAAAQAISYSPRTGDDWIDSELGTMNDYGRGDRDFFIDDVVGTFGAPRYLLKDLLEVRQWAPGDVYYACALAYQLRRPCGDVVTVYEKDGAQGWGTVALNLGIKPGSEQFRALKSQVAKSSGKFKLNSSVEKAEAEKAEAEKVEDEKVEDEKEKSEDKEEKKDKEKGDAP